MISLLNAAQQILSVVADNSRTVETVIMFGVAGVLTPVLGWICVSLVAIKVSVADLTGQFRRFVADLESEKGTRKRTNSEITRRIEKLEDRPKSSSQTGAVLALCALLMVSGCSLIPKSVEFGQDKVRKFPAHPVRQLEAERQAVQLSAVKAREAELEATLDGSAAAKPAGESAELSEAVGRSLGPPSSPWTAEVSTLSQKLDAQTAKYNSLLAKFKAGNDENAGKKIEGTGFLQVPYLLYIGIVGGIIWVVWLVLRTVANVAAASNPGVAVGLKVAKVGGKTLSRGFSQMLKGGQDFKAKVEEGIEDPAVKAQILEYFRTSHEVNQDADVQSLIKKLKE